MNESNCPSNSKSSNGTREKIKHTLMHTKEHRWNISKAVGGSFILDMLHALLK